MAAGWRPRRPAGGRLRGGCEQRPEL